MPGGGEDGRDVGNKTEGQVGRDVEDRTTPAVGQLGGPAREHDGGQIEADHDEAGGAQRLGLAVDDEGAGQGDHPVTKQGNEQGDEVPPADAGEPVAGTIARVDDGSVDRGGIRVGYHDVDSPAEGAKPFRTRAMVCPGHSASWDFCSDGI